MWGFPHLMHSWLKTYGSSFHSEESVLIRDCLSAISFSSPWMCSTERESCLGMRYDQISWASLVSVLFLVPPILAK